MWISNWSASERGRLANAYDAVTQDPCRPEWSVNHTWRNERKTTAEYQFKLRCYSPKENSCISDLPAEENVQHAVTPLGTGQYLWEYETGKWEVAGANIYRGPVDISFSDSVRPRTQLFENCLWPRWNLYSKYPLVPYSIFPRDLYVNNGILA